VEVVNVACPEPSGSSSEGLNLPSRRSRKARLAVLDRPILLPTSWRSLMDSTGLPLHRDNQTIVRERIHLDDTNPNVLYDEITTIDHAFTRPWANSCLGSK
jgi:hypothetical protein